MGSQSASTFTSPTTPTRLWRRWRSQVLQSTCPLSLSLFICVAVVLLRSNFVFPQCDSMQTSACSTRLSTNVQWPPRSQSKFHFRKFSPLWFSVANNILRMRFGVQSWLISRWCNVLMTKVRSVLSLPSCHEIGDVQISILLGTIKIFYMRLIKDFFNIDGKSIKC